MQDDDNDRTKELERMSQIYKGASITISAAKATHSEQGFLQNRDILHAYVATYDFRWTDRLEVD